MSAMRYKALGLLVAALLIVAGGFTLVSAAQQTAIDPLKSDFSSASWTESFNKLHARLSQEYAFTDWKGIDWNKLHEKYAAEIKTAQERNDFDAYYIALRNYLHEIPDGHVSATNIAKVDDKYVSGGFGLAVARVDDGRIVVTWVDQAGPAWAAGIRPGAELVKWNGQDTAAAVAKVSTVFTSTSATKVDLERKQVQYLVRAPIGQQISLAFADEQDSKPREVTLVAYDDKKASLKKTYPDAVLSDRIRDAFLGIDNPNPMPESIVEKKMIDGGISYIKVWAELDADLQETGKTPSTLELFRQAVQEAIDNQSKGIILDLRNNMGGSDEMTAAMLGSFYAEKTLYEYLNAFDPATRQHGLVLADPATNSQALYIDPVSQRYNGRIVALVNPKCVSSGEGLAKGVHDLPNGETLGFYGTNGSFGMAGAEALMPGAITVHWPFGQSLDKGKEVQLDSRNGIGGVSPSIRIPMTVENAIRIANGEDVELEAALRIFQ